MLAPIESIAVVIPAYNEEGRIAGTLEQVRRYLRERVGDSRILVVDDGSSDRTVEVVRDVGASGETSVPIEVLQNGRNRGKGYSVRRGVLAAQEPWILFSDADLSTPIEELATLAAGARQHDVVIASRGMKQSRLLKRQPFYREAMGRIFNVMVQAAALPGLYDTQCGFKLWRRAVGHDVFSRVTLEGFGFDVEALFIARCLGYRIAEVPVTWVDDRATKVRPIRDSTQMAADLLRTRRRHRHLGRLSAGAAPSPRRNRT